VFARPDVDVGGLNRIGRRHRVVGVSYADELSHYHFLDPDFEKLLASLAKALPGQLSLRIDDSSMDENKLLIRAGSDHDPGVYYLFDKKLRQLETFLVVRGELEGIKLASVKPIHYEAADGTMIPGYLTLPPGVDTPKDLPAIVMPHGGPSARDYWCCSRTFGVQGAMEMISSRKTVFALGRRLLAMCWMPASGWLRKASRAPVSSRL
jgi:dipeptidyl aminopeptidase/acylaminoacyl peptidase